MIEVTNSIGQILAFDGRVLELFGMDKRIHIRQLTSIEAEENKKGVLQITGSSRIGFFAFVGIDPSQRANVGEFIRQVNAARC
jgi:hypothetical protein